MTHEPPAVRPWALAFYLALATMLAGFTMAAITAGAAGPVVTGSLGLFATLATIALRIDADSPRTGRNDTRQWPR